MDSSAVGDHARSPCAVLFMLPLVNVFSFYRSLLPSYFPGSFLYFYTHYALLDSSLRLGLRLALRLALFLSLAAIFVSFLCSYF